MHLKKIQVLIICNTLLVVFLGDYNIMPYKNVDSYKHLFRVFRYRNMTGWKARRRQLVWA